MCIDNLKHSYWPRFNEFTFLNNPPPPPHLHHHHHHRRHRRRRHRRGGSVIERLTRDKEVAMGTALCL